jgi:hypothetical protein
MESVQGGVMCARHGREDQCQPGPWIEDGGLRISKVGVAAVEAKDAEGKFTSPKGSISQVSKHIKSVGEIP